MECVVQDGRTVSDGKKLYGAGEVVDLPPETAERLAALGFVSTDAEAAPRSEDENTLPGDLPGRDSLFAAGFEEIQAVLELDEDDLVEIEGIGKATARKILSYEV